MGDRPDPPLALKYIKKQEEDSRRGQIFRRLVYHYRRASLSLRNIERGEFLVLLRSPDGKYFKFGFDFEGGNFYTPKKIIALIDEGWELILITSTFEWWWTSYRYGDLGVGHVEEDCYGRIRSILTFNGWFTKVDVFCNEAFKQFGAKGYWCAETDQDKLLYNNIPKKIEEFIAFGKWEGEYLKWYDKYEEHSFFREEWMIDHLLSLLLSMWMHGGSLKEPRRWMRREKRRKLRKEG